MDADQCIVVVVASEDLYFHPWSTNLVYRSQIPYAIWHFLATTDIVDYRAVAPGVEPPQPADLWETNYDQGWQQKDLDQYKPHVSEIVEFLDNMFTGKHWNCHSYVVPPRNTVRIKFFSQPVI